MTSAPVTVTRAADDITREFIRLASAESEPASLVLAMLDEFIEDLDNGEVAVAIPGVGR